MHSGLRPITFYKESGLAYKKQTFICDTRAGTEKKGGSLAVPKNLFKFFKKYIFRN